MTLLSLTDRFLSTAREEMCAFGVVGMLKDTLEREVTQDTSSLAIKFSQDTALLRLRCASYFSEK